MIKPTKSFVYDPHPLVVTRNISSYVSSNSEAFPSELCHSVANYYICLDPYATGETQFLLIIKHLLHNYGGI